jgi:aryl-alcohol dehydrogenase-like predicted oxidoreductase
MNYQQLGNSDVQVSKVCLGTMTFGQQNDETEACEQLDYARDQGINFIDTAEMYPVPPRAETVHRTETIVGNWLKHQNREQLIIATKITGGARNMPWIRGGALPFDRANIEAAVDASLRRLNTDYIDLYQLHWPERNTPMFGEYLYDPDNERTFTPIAETLTVLADLVQAGKIRHIGLSNEWPWGVMQFLNASNDTQLPRIISIQNAYSLLNRSYETALLELCHREQLSLLAYSPLAFGLLSGKYLDAPNASGRITLFPGFGQRYEKPMVQPAVREYCTLARDFGLTPTEFALGFVYSRWFVGSTIIGATTMTQLKENIQAFSIPWTDEMETAVQDMHLRFFNPAP